MDSMSFTNDLRSDFLRRMKSARLDAKLKQTDVIKELEKYGVKMGPSTYAKVERGERKLDFAEALAVAQVLGFSVSDMAPEPVKANQEIMREAQSVIGTGIAAQKDIEDSISPVLRALWALERLKSLVESDGSSVQDDLDRKLVDALLQPELPQKLREQAETLRAMSAWFNRFENLRFYHEADKFNRDNPGPSELPTEPDWTQSRFGYPGDGSES